MIKVATLVGARPQFIKAAAISRVFKSSFPQVKEWIIHSGQHYDVEMSEVFFDELEISKPDYNLGIGSGSHSEQTGKIGMALESILIDLNPDVLIIYGDTNTTLAGAITAAKIGIPVAHIESGLRSYNQKMPEEINRIIADRLSTFLFCPTDKAFSNLSTNHSENHNSPNSLHPLIMNSGDVMYDTSLYYSNRKNNDFLRKLKINGKFVLATIHRDFNTDNKSRLNSIMDALVEISKVVQVILPLHPRTKAKFEEYSISTPSSIKVIHPLSYTEMLFLEKNSELIITDSGGVQKESFFFKKPCIVLREETEWTEIVENGNAVLTGSDYDSILNAFQKLRNESKFSYPQFYGDGNASFKICKTLVDNLK